MLTTLGHPFEFRVGGVPHKWSNSKHLALLVYLVLEPRPYRREELARLIWSQPDDNALSDALSALRAVFGPEAFPPRAPLVHFDPSLIRCDAVQLLDARAAAHRREEGWALYRGPFLDDFRARGTSERFRKWMLAKRELLEKTWLELADAACADAAERGDWRRVEQVSADVLSRVPGWGAGEAWLASARAALDEAPREADPAPPSPAVPQPRTEAVEAAAAAGPGTPASRRRNRIRLPLLIAGSGAILALCALLLMRPLAGRLAHARAPAAGPCPPGGASGSLVREIYQFGARIRPGVTFTKGWVFQNTGTCTWPTRLELRYAGSRDDTLSLVQAPLRLARPVPPGESYRFSVPMRGPATPGIYEEQWVLVDPQGPPGRRRIALFLAHINVPEATYPPCGAGQARAALAVSRLPDSAVVAAGSRFLWTWSLRNSGECAWHPGTRLHQVSHGGSGRITAANASALPTRPVLPRESYTFVVPATAPANPAEYQETWVMRDGFGRAVNVENVPELRILLNVRPSDAPYIPPVCKPGEAVVGFLNEDYPDDAFVRPGTRFLKRWTITNDGQCSLSPEFRFERVDSAGKLLSLSTRPIPLGNSVLPRGSYTVEVPMRAPREAGPHTEYWRLVHPSGEPIIISATAHLWVRIIVPE